MWRVGNEIGTTEIELKSALADILEDFEVNHAEGHYYGISQVVVSSRHAIYLYWKAS
jgi:hypothetical protein